MGGGGGGGGGGGQSYDWDYTIQYVAKNNYIEFD